MEEKIIKNENDLLLSKEKNCLMLWNDDINEMGYIVAALHSICGIDIERSTQIMLTAHETGNAIITCGTYDEIHKMKNVLNSKGITATVE